MTNHFASPGTVAAVAGIMAAFYGADVWLAKLESREVNAEARGLYAQGERLLAAKQAERAVGVLQRARYLERTDRAYELGLAEAQLANGKIADAKATLQGALDRDSNDGQANLLMARAMVEEHDAASADSYYHRAIYGGWPKDAGSARLRARLELADLLAREQRKEELLSEVLLLANAGGPPAKVAALYLEAGSAARAAEAYRAMLRTNPADPDALSGLGQAELLRGDFRAAHAAFASALRRRPEDANVAKRLQLAGELEELDPTLRWLSSAEKFRRSQQVLALTADAATGCSRGERPQHLDELLAEAGRLRIERIPAAPANELAEVRLTTAEEIWKAQSEACRAASAGEAVAMIHKKLEQ